MRELKKEGLNATESNLHLSKLIAELMYKEDLITKLRAEVKSILKEITKILETE